MTTIRFKKDLKLDRYEFEHLEDFRSYLREKQIDLEVDEIPKKILDELDRRMERIKSGTSKTRPVKEVLRRFKEKE